MWSPSCTGAHFLRTGQRSPHLPGQGAEGVEQLVAAAVVERHQQRETGVGPCLVHDVVDAPAVLYTHASELRAAQEIWPKITFHAMREHGGRVVHSDRLAA